MLDEKLRGAAFAVTISDYNLRLLTGWYGRLADRVEVIHCGVDAAVFRPRPGPEHVASGAREGTPLEVLSIATLQPQKGHAILVAAARRMVERGVAVRVRMVGEGEERPALEAAIAAAGLDRPGPAPGATATRSGRRAAGRGRRRRPAEHRAPERQDRGHPGRADGGAGERRAGRRDVGVGRPGARRGRRDRPAGAARRRGGPRRCPHRHPARPGRGRPACRCRPGAGPRVVRPADEHRHLAERFIEVARAAGRQVEPLSPETVGQSRRPRRRGARRVGDVGDATIRRANRA